METLFFDLQKGCGKFKNLNCVHGGPWGRRNSQFRSIFAEYSAARIPYSRNHDLGLKNHFSHDVSQIFRNFDADENDPNSYDFAITDDQILYTLDAGTKTFYRLGESIDNDIKKHRSYPPKDFNKWARICEHIIRHYTEGWANGYTLDMPYWEIWNEPDIGEKCWLGTKEEFFDFFEIAAKHLKSCFPHLKIGGPGSVGARKTNAFVNDFIGEMSKRGVPLDFYTWHRYTIEPENTIERAEMVRETLNDAGYTKTEVIIDEWNYVRGWREDFQYSLNAIHGHKGAAYMMATISAAQASYAVDMMVYYDNRPSSVYNGIFDYYTCKPLKGYYAIAWYGQNYYDLEKYVPCKTECKELYTLCGTDKAGKITCIVTHYSENDETLPKSVKLDFGRSAEFEVYLVDKEHNGELVKVTTETEFVLPPHSFMLLKEV